MKADSGQSSNPVRMFFGNGESQDAHFGKSRKGKRIQDIHFFDNSWRLVGVLKSLALKSLADIDSCPKITGRFPVIALGFVNTVLAFPDLVL